MFKQEAAILQDQLGSVAKAIHHIGSTSVPGLKAKPIIDILIDATELNELDARSEAMQSIGYEVMGEFGIPGRRYFRKGREERSHHVHCFQSGDSNLTRHLAFRDYLIEHKNIAREYADLKSALVELCNDDMGKYCDGKDPFIQLHESKAVEWYTNLSNR